MYLIKYNSVLLFFVVVTDPSITLVGVASDLTGNIDVIVGRDWKRTA